jgi:hypothetical protein
MAAFSYKTFEDAVRIAQTNLDGRERTTAAIHSNNVDHSSTRESLCRSAGSS